MIDYNKLFFSIYNFILHSLLKIIKKRLTAKMGGRESNPFASLLEIEK